MAGRQDQLFRAHSGDITQDRLLHQIKQAALFFGIDIAAIEPQRVHMIRIRHCHIKPGVVLAACAAREQDAFGLQLFTFAG